MKLAIVTIAIGEKHKALGEKTHPFMKAYAKRCNADFICLDETTPFSLSSSPYFYKYHIGELLKTYDRIVYFDTDIIVHPIAPNLFWIVPPDRFGAVFGPPNLGGDDVFVREHFGEKWNESANLGMFVISKQHREIFNPELGLAGCHWNGEGEQLQLVHNLFKLKIPLKGLPFLFNHSYDIRKSYHHAEQIGYYYRQDRLAKGSFAIIHPNGQNQVKRINEWLKVFDGTDQERYNCLSRRFRLEEDWETNPAAFYNMIDFNQLQCNCCTEADWWKGFLWRELVLDDTYCFDQLFRMPPEAVVDLGANIGCYSLLARAHWPEARIVSLEPSPVALDDLQNNTEGKGIEVYEVGIGNGEKSLSRDSAPNPNPGSNRLHPSEEGMKTIRLSELFREKNLNPETTYIKSDCEGGEHSFFDPEELALIKKVPAMVIEFHGFDDKPLPTEPFRDWCEELRATHVCSFSPPPFRRQKKDGIKGNLIARIFRRDLYKKIPKRLRRKEVLW